MSEKKTVSYYLPKRTIEALEKMASDDYTKPSRIIERLVDQATLDPQPEAAAGKRPRRPRTR